MGRARAFRLSEYHDQVIDDLTKAWKKSATAVLRELIDIALDSSPDVRLTSIRLQIGRKEKSLEADMILLNELETEVAARPKAVPAEPPRVAPPKGQFKDLRQTNGTALNKAEVLRLLPDIASGTRVSDKTKAWVKDHLLAHPEWIAGVVPDRRKALFEALDMHSTSTNELQGVRATNGINADARAEGEHV